jgi:SHS2 domain-containing protein
VTYRFLPHTADIRAAIEAPTFTALLDEVVALLRELTAGSGPPSKHESTRPLSVTGSDPAELLIQFAREVLTAFQLDAIVPVRLELDTVQLPPGGTPSIRGRLWGEPFDPTRHATQPEIKAVTRHGLAVRQDEAGWHAELVIDV